MFKEWSAPWPLEADPGYDPGRGVRRRPPSPGEPLAMLHFLSSLFAPGESLAAGPDGLDPALIDAAIERAVDGTDRRLRALADYRKRLREPVAVAVGHVVALVESLPEPAEISPRTFGLDPRVRAFFSSTEHLREVLTRFKGLRQCHEAAAASADAVFGLLTLEMAERSVLGMALDGDAVRRDVLQTSVNFYNHRYLCAAGEEADSRWEIKKRAFDFLVEQALSRLVEEKQKRDELERQKQLLRGKLGAMRAGSWGLDAAFADDAADPPDMAALEAEIEAIEAELDGAAGAALGLAESLERVAETLGQPGDWLAAREIALRLDYRGVKVAESSGVPAADLRLTELYSGNGARRVALFGRVPRSEIPAPPDFLKEASRYLG